ncbi:entry exclusion protein TrbK [Rhizobium binxianense]|jgi:Ti type entry exclusion protein TrbK
MVMYRVQIEIAVLIIAAAGGGLVWLVMPAAEPDRPVDTVPAGSQGIGDRRQQAKEFFGEKREYDLKGGQEMRPRW